MSRMFSFVHTFTTFLNKKLPSRCLWCADILLCHDDELDTRRVAFALYLTPSWSKEDGGLLDLFDMDGVYATQI